MHLKRYLTCLLLLALLGLCACGAAQTGNTQPGATAAPGITATPEPTATPAPVTLRISELMANNNASLMYDGGFPDWVELYNYGSASVSTAGLSLEADGESSAAAPQEIAPGGYALLLLPEGGIKKNGGELKLYNGSELLDSVSYPAMGKDESCCVDENGNLTVGTLCTPGYENTDAGYYACADAATAGAELIINEVMVYNDRFDLNNGSLDDWAELKNNGSSPINTGDYYLTDTGKEPLRYAIPATVLQPGETMLVFFTGEEGNGAPFELNAQYDTLYLARSDGSLADCMLLRGIPYGGSIGREAGRGGLFYFTEPSPGSENSGGYRLVAQKPVAESPDGVFENVSNVTVALSAPGTIYYTTDGSTPTENSTLYTGPFNIVSTTAIRAVNVEEGKLNSESAMFTYVINEGFTLPVVSVVTDPSNLYGSSGIYDHPTADWERTATVEFIDGEDGFTIDCGIKTHGATSRTNMVKKSFKLTFRSRYDGQLNYDLFDNGVTEFASVLLRYAQEDNGGTQMRDVLLHQLSRECCPELPTQDSRYAIFYLNGQYWGIYAIREAHSPTHYANHYGYDVDTVTQWKEVWDSKSQMQEVYSYLMNNDMADPECYAYVASHIDIESTIAWTIIEAYSGNQDLNSPNVRFYYSTEDEVMRFALVDLDATMYAWYTCAPSVAYSGYAFAFITGRLMQNAEYRALLLQRMSEYLQGPLSDENVAAEISALNDILEPEMPRDAARWGRWLDPYYISVNAYYNFVSCGYGRANQTIHYLDGFLRITAEEWETWFSWATR